MSVRCKFKVDSINRTQQSRAKVGDDGKYIKDDRGNYIYEPTEMWSVKMSPVYSNEPGHENKAFWDATPSGSFEFGTVNKAAVDSLELGAEYYIDITPAAKAE
jgi:hypothetical protein